MDRYEEALAKARAGKSLEEIFPELAEGEDERIRQELIEYLTHRAEVTGFINEEKDCKRWIAYLERQKAKERLDRMAPIYNDKESFESALEKAWKYYNESASRTVDSFEDDYIECVFSKGFREGFLYKEKQKENLKTADSIPSNCTSDAKCENRWHKVEDSLPDNGRLVLANDCLGNTLLARYDGEGNWEVSVYDNEDYYCRNTITKWCEIPSEKQKEQKGANGNEKEIPNEQKPADWSEEDEKMLQRIIRHTESEYQDWCNDKYGNLEIVSDGKRSCLERLDWLENRLKSLHQQPHWKPSDEQMNALYDILHPTDPVNPDAVKSLYDDLKNL